MTAAEGVFLLLLGWSLALSACGAGRASENTEPLVDFKALHPRVVLDIRYATENNFTGKKVYPVARCALRETVAARLRKAILELERLGYKVKVYDCYRPLSAQKRFWELVPDERYVAHPAKGSRHNRGAAVDLTLADSQGRELEMPTAYDDFSEKAHRRWRGASPVATKNRALLERVMRRHGLLGLETEWWHFDAKGWERYPVEDISLESLP